MPRNRHNPTWGQYLRQSDVGVAELDNVDRPDDIWYMRDAKGKLTPKLDADGNQITRSVEKPKPMAASTLSLLDEVYSKGR